jgi:hypothetical protein
MVSRIKRSLLPAIDSHTGTVPALGTDVMTDHWLLFGSDDAGDDWGEPVLYDRQLRHTLLDFLPPRVAGLQVSQPLPNGDFAIAYDDLLHGRLDRIERLVPACIRQRAAARRQTLGPFTASGQLSS